jgi:putative nucleotidyltransferase with HDIG domain
MSPELSLKLAAAVESMPAFPKSVQKILQLTRDMNCSPKDLVQVIDKDPVVTVKVLRVVNSAYYGLPKQITSISHAVVYLGFNTLKNLALGIAAMGMLPTENAAGFNGQKYLVHSLTTASLAKQLALRVVSADPMDCFIAGLLHDFGKVVIAQYLPQEFRRALETSQWHEISLHLALRQVIGVDHAVVGSMLVEKWRFPQDLVDTLRHQYSPELMDTPMLACVFAANQISKHFEAGARTPLVLPPSVALRLGGTGDAILADLGELAPVFQDARQFSKV